jgi:hypothetical protein
MLWRWEPTFAGGGRFSSPSKRTTSLQLGNRFQDMRALLETILLGLCDGFSTSGTRSNVDM